MNAFTVHVAYDFRSALRNPSQLLMNYLFPIGVYLILGLIMTQINPLFSKTLLPAMVLLAGMASFLLGFPGPLVEAREAGVFRSFKLGGVPPFSILFIPLLTTILHFAIASLIIVLTAGPLFGGAMPVGWGAFALITLLCAVNYGAIGAIIGVVATNSRVTMMLSQLIFLPSMLLGGLMVPLTMLPASIRGIAFILPTTHMMQAYQAAAYRQSSIEPLFWSVFLLSLSTLIALALAVLLFSWDKRSDSRRRSPLIALASLLPFIASAFLLH
ncbi:MAG TPA: ABC transporter permease [Spirochaetia bacterium]|nr:ABC transporter permease [Spirochaetia bacterium]